jgi:hypothetical protein
MNFDVVVGLILAIAVAYILADIWGRMTRPTEPDEHADVPARLGPRPKSGVSAVALEEPDEGDEISN